ncbi:MAG: DNA topoisomerase (ATP-hydrolyzing) subunit B [Candidatus Magasanikbacteria bacterium]
MPIKRVQRGRIEAIPEKAKIKDQKLRPATEKPTPKTETKPSSTSSKNTIVSAVNPSGSYSAKDITVLEGLEAVRRRPGMYIGTTGPVGLHHLVREIVDNSVDEAMAGFCDQITVALLPDHQISVHDNGRGIPVDIHPTKNVSALEVIMTVLHAGGKFGGEGYKVSGGLHGVGASVVNALSKYVKVEVHTGGKVWVQEYKNGGKPVKKVACVGTCKDHGTTITFRPDDTIFETINWEWKTIIDHLRQTTYLTKGLHLIIKDERPAEEKDIDKTALPMPSPVYQFFFEGGIASYVQYINHNKHPKHDTVFYTEKEANDVHVEVALQYSDEFSESLSAFTNNIYNPEGGTHVQGFRTALTRSLNTYARNKNILKEKDDNLTGEDVLEGLSVIISVKIREPQFEGQTKGKLGNTEAKTAVETVMNDEFLIYLEEHPRDAEAIVGKCILASKARNAAKLARDTILRKGALEGFTLPGKLADCSSRHAEESELFIVEGDSAGGCFDGDTEVALVDGRELSFIELVAEFNQGKQNYCYTIKNDGNIGVEKILYPRITKQNASVIKVVLDNGAELTCTPDHKFMVRDGSYVEAQNLTSDTELRTKTEPNHKVVRIEKIDKKIDVYDIEVPNTHNFALASGVFVHNSAKQGRDREHQAILPLRGKVLNVERARLDKILTNNELKSLIIAMGTNIGEQFDITKLRYHHIVIMTDADVDGAHIRTLLLTFFYRYFPALITEGHVYIAQPPLFSVKFGKEMKYAYNDEEKEAIIAEISKNKLSAAEEKQAKKTKEETAEATTNADGDEEAPVESVVIGGMKVNIQRYKGLGEMNPDQLWDTTMDPTKRLMKKVTVPDAELANSVFETLMGDDVAQRKKFIQTHAKSVQNIDV